MKVKFIKNFPDWKSICIYQPRNWLELNEIYDVVRIDFNQCSTPSYELNGFWYPADWFEVIEYQSPLQPSEWANASDTLFNNRV